jgi:hypothetical protein
MFNLEQAFTEWRENMLACGIETPVPLKELELHLREEMERQVGKGMDAQQAFEEATKSIGEAKTLKAEFKKLPATPRDKFHSILVILFYVTFGLFLCQQGYGEVAAVDFNDSYIHGSLSYINLFSINGPFLDLVEGLCELLGGLGILGGGLMFILLYPNCGALVQLANRLTASAFCSIRNLCGAGGSRA